MRRCLSALLLLGVLALQGPAYGQNNRLWDDNNILWLNNFANVRLTDRWGLHAEYQFRREACGLVPQQHLLRTGLNYQATDRVLLRAGYAFIATYPYGDFPLQAAGVAFPEHRAFQMLQLTDRHGQTEVSHRYMLEQRWVGRFTDREATQPAEWVFSNRMRYMLRVQRPLGQPNARGGRPYLAAYNEVFVSFGRNVGANVFDQNRLAGLVGYTFSPRVRLEAGPFSQILQLPRQIEGRTTFQNNLGAIVNAYWTVDLRRPAAPAP